MCSSFAQGIQLQSSALSVGLNNQQKLFQDMSLGSAELMGKPEDSLFL